MMSSNTLIRHNTSTHANLSTKQLYIFDWDGTVMDSVGHIVASLLWAGNEHGITISADSAKDIIGLGLPEAMRVLFPDYPEKWEAIKADYATHYVAHSKNTLLFDGMEQLITGLHAQGKTLAVATGKSRKGLDRVLEDSGLEHYFSATRGADETKSKPDPLMLTEILTQTGIEARHAVMIGDTSYDMAMAQNLTMDRVAVTYGVHKADVLADYQPHAIVDSVAELSSLLVKEE